MARPTSMASDSPPFPKISSSSILIDTSSLQTPFHKTTLASAPSSRSPVRPPGTVEVLCSQPLMEKPDGAQNQKVLDSQPEVEATGRLGRSPSVHEASLVRDSLQDPGHVTTSQAAAHKDEDEDNLYSLSPEIAARLAQQASQKSSQARAAQLSALHPRIEPITPMPPKGSRNIGAITSDEALKAPSSMQRLHELRANRNAAPAQISEPQRNNIERQTDTRDLARPNLLALPVNHTVSTFKPNLLVPQIPAKLIATEKNSEKTPAAPVRHSGRPSDVTAALVNPVFTTHKIPGSLQKIKKLAHLATNSDSARFSEPTNALPVSPWEVEVSPEGPKKSSEKVPKRKRGRPRKSDPAPAKAQLVPDRIRPSAGTRSLKATVGSEDDDNDMDYVNLSVNPPATAARPTRASRNNGPLLELPLTRGKRPQKQAVRSSKGGPEVAEDHQGQDNVRNHETLDEFVDAVTNNHGHDYIEFETTAAKQRIESFESNHEPHQANDSEDDLQGQSGTRHEVQHEQLSHTKHGDHVKEFERPQHGQRQTTMSGQAEVDTSVQDEVVGTRSAYPVIPERRGTQDAPINVMSDPPSADDDENDLDQYGMGYQNRKSDLPELETRQRAPFVPYNPPAAPKVDGKRFTNDSLRIAERASRINKPHMIHFSDKGPRNQGTLSGKKTAHSRNRDQAFSTNGRDPRLSVQKQRRPETIAEEAMQEILGHSAKRSKNSVDDTTCIDDDYCANQIASPTYGVLAAQAAPTAFMAPPPKPLVGSVFVKPQTLTDTSVPSCHQAPSASKVTPPVPMLPPVDTALMSTTFGQARVETVSKRCKPVENEEQESDKPVKRSKFASSILAASPVTNPVPPSILAKSSMGIHQAGLGKSILGQPVKENEQEIKTAPRMKAQAAEANTIASPALVKAGVKRQSHSDHAALSKRPKVIVGKDPQRGLSPKFTGDAAPRRKFSQRTITDDGSPIRQEQEESYSLQQLNSEQVPDEEIERVQNRGRYSTNILTEHVMAQRDASARNDTGMRVVEAPEWVLPEEAPKRSGKHQFPAAEEESQAISHAGFDHENHEEIISQQNPFSDLAEDPFVITAEERKKKEAMQPESRAQQREESFLGRLRLGIRQAIEEQQDEDDPDKTLVEVESGHEQTDEGDDKSSQSSSSHTRQIKVHFEDEFTRRVRALEPHQRSFHDGMFRVVHELVSHLIDAETAVQDVVHDCSSDCAMLLKQMEESQREKLDDYIQSATTTKKELATGFKIITKRIEKDMVEVAASRVESEESIGQGDGNALTKLDDLLQRFTGEGWE